jgi:hypothetical protein
MSYLIHSVNGKVVSRTYAKGYVHENNVFCKMLEQLDPFVRNGQVIAWTDEGCFSYQPRKVA